MGSGPSRDVRLSFPRQDMYAAWTVDGVQRAIQRWSELPEKRSLFIRRKEFVDIFSDIESLQNGSFASLPLEEFDIYARGRQAVFAAEVRSRCVACCQSHSLLRFSSS